MKLSPVPLVMREIKTASQRGSMSHHPDHNRDIMWQPYE